MGIDTRVVDLDLAPALNLDLLARRTDFNAGDDPNASPVVVDHDPGRGLGWSDLDGDPKVKAVLWMGDVSPHTYLSHCQRRRFRSR